MPLCNPFPWMWVGLVLANRIGQRWWDGCGHVHVIMLHKIVTTFLLGPLLRCWLWRSKQPCCGLLTERVRHWSTSCHPARKRPLPDAHEELNSANHHVSLQDETPALADTSIAALQKTQSSLLQTSLRNCDIINMYIFDLLCLLLYCYASTHNTGFIRWKVLRGTLRRYKKA